MAYQRSEYHREVNRDVDEPKQSGWKSWFGLGDNKDRDEDRDRGYNYQSTTTYRTNPPTYGGYGDRYTERTGPYSSGYAGARGGYGYTSSDEVTRPSWNTDRDYQTRTSYGQPTGERDVYYKAETRTYGGDRDTWNTPRDYHPTPRYTTETPSRNYGYGYDHNTSRDYPTSRDYTSRDYHPTRDYTTTRDYPTTSSRYPVTGGFDHPSTYGPTPSRGYGFERDTYTSTGRNYPETPSRGYGGYTGTGYGGDSYSTRPSYQQTSYRY